MTEFRTLYWKLLTIYARLIGGAFTFGGIIFIIWGIRLLVDHNSTIMINGSPTNDPYMKAIVLFMSVFVGVSGVLLLKARPFRNSK